MQIFKVQKDENQIDKLACYTIKKTETGIADY